MRGVGVIDLTVEATIMLVLNQTHQVQVGRHDQAGGDRGSDRGSRKLECGEQHRGGKTLQLNLNSFLDDRFWITLLETPGGMVTSSFLWPCPRYIRNPAQSSNLYLDQMDN